MLHLSINVSFKSMLLISVAGGQHRSQVRNKSLVYHGPSIHKTFALLVEVNTHAGRSYRLQH